MTNRVLVTGGLGYIGGRVARHLAMAGFEVCLGTRKAGLDAPPWLPGARMVHTSWDDPQSLRQACRGLSAVIHLAAMNEIDSAKDLEGALRMNGLASLRMLEAAVAEAVPRFVYFSTAHVYGAPLQGNLDEATLPRPQHPYAITHKVAEDFVLAAHDKNQIEGLVFRLSNGFGAPATHEVDRWTLLVNDLCRQAAVSGRVKLNTPGTQLRDFITLEDVARAVVHGLRLDKDKLADGLFNLGKGVSSSIFAMTQRVAVRWEALTGKSLPIDRPEPSGEEPEPLAYSSDKFKRTGFVLRDAIDEEIDATLQLTRRAFGH